MFFMRTPLNQKGDNKMDKITNIDMCIASTEYSITQLQKEIKNLECKLKALQIMREELLKGDFPL